jgi:protein-tyrosine phosphatase
LPAEPREGNRAVTELLWEWSRGVADDHGRKQAWLRHRAARWLHRLGSYEEFQTIDGSRVVRFVFVCAGNVCRSRYAEARAQALGLEATSFGLSADGQSFPDAAAIEAARRRSLELEHRPSRRARDVRPTAADLLVAMEPHQARQLRREHPRSQVTLLGLWCLPVRPVLADPYGLSPSYFDSCFGCIDQGIQALARAVEHRRVLP